VEQVGGGEVEQVGGAIRDKLYEGENQSVGDGEDTEKTQMFSDSSDGDVKGVFGGFNQPTMAEVHRVSEEAEMFSSGLTGSDNIIQTTCDEDKKLTTETLARETYLSDFDSDDKDDPDGVIQTTFNETNKVTVESEQLPIDLESCYLETDKETDDWYREVVSKDNWLTTGDLMDIPSKEEEAQEEKGNEEKVKKKRGRKRKVVEGGKGDDEEVKKKRGEEGRNIDVKNGDNEKVKKKRGRPKKVAEEVKLKSEVENHEETFNEEKFKKRGGRKRKIEEVFEALRKSQNEIKAETSTDISNPIDEVNKNDLETLNECSRQESVERDGLMGEVTLKEEVLDEITAKEVFSAFPILVDLADDEDADLDDIEMDLDVEDSDEEDLEEAISNEKKNNYKDDQTSGIKETKLPEEEFLSNEKRNSDEIKTSSVVNQPGDQNKDMDIFEERKINRIDTVLSNEQVCFEEDAEKKDETKDEGVEDAETASVIFVESKERTTGEKILIGNKNCGVTVGVTEKSSPFVLNFDTLMSKLLTTDSLIEKASVETESEMIESDNEKLSKMLHSPIEGTQETKTQIQEKTDESNEKGVAEKDKPPIVLNFDSLVSKEEHTDSDSIIKEDFNQIILTKGAETKENEKTESGHNNDKKIVKDNEAETGEHTETETEEHNETDTENSNEKDTEDNNQYLSEEDNGTNSENCETESEENNKTVIENNEQGIEENNKTNTVENNKTDNEIETEDHNETNTESTYEKDIEDINETESEKGKETNNEEHNETKNEGHNETEIAEKNRTESKENSEREAEEYNEREIENDEIEAKKRNKEERIDSMVIFKRIKVMCKKLKVDLIGEEHSSEAIEKKSLDVNDDVKDDKAANLSLEEEEEEEEEREGHKGVNQSFVKEESADGSDSEEEDETSVLRQLGLGLESVIWNEEEEDEKEPGELDFFEDGGKAEDEEEEDDTEEEEEEDGNEEEDEEEDDAEEDEDDPETTEGAKGIDEDGADDEDDDEDDHETAEGEKGMDEDVAGDEEEDEDDPETTEGAKGIDEDGADDEDDDEDDHETAEGEKGMDEDVAGDEEEDEEGLDVTYEEYEDSEPETEHDEEKESAEKSLAEFGSIETVCDGEAGESGNPVSCPIVVDELLSKYSFLKG